MRFNFFSQRKVTYQYVAAIAGLLRHLLVAFQLILNSVYFFKSNFFFFNLANIITFSFGCGVGWSVRTSVLFLIYFKYLSKRKI